MLISFLFMPYLQNLLYLKYKTTAKTWKKNCIFYKYWIVSFISIVKEKLNWWEYIGQNEKQWKPIFLNIPKKSSVILTIIDTNTIAPIIKQQPKGLKYKLNKVIDTNPSYVTRHNNLQPATIHNYINNFNLKNIIICSAML